MNYLYQEGLFIDQVEGQGLGEEYEILTNKFEILKGIDFFFNNEFDFIQEKISIARKKIMNEHRRQNGLPPINR